MRSPVLLDCADIIEDPSSQLPHDNLTCKRCNSQQKVIFRAVNAVTSLIYRDNDKKWSSVVVDYSRQLIKERVFFHSCGMWFNYSSLNVLYGTDLQYLMFSHHNVKKEEWRNVNVEKNLAKLFGKMCPHCENEFSSNSFFVCNVERAIDQTPTENIRDLLSK